ncbi:hypothetical protein [Furfurilactobacillus milii]|uniref:Uncharacterized protein n=1 Tax=Furfurilactobacillus milii TaxID=2888272 RepID=A0A6N9HZR2_9LACO|nr:hypothetical protein [Furfurilactobacillus milii]MYV16068.1 hypothetical protein [Furfurilactobacillus milii]
MNFTARINKQETFIDDYLKHVRPDSWQDCYALLEGIVQSLLESKNKHHEIIVQGKDIYDGMNKRFAFTGFQTEYGLEIYYCGVGNA